jgi:hypothetical protein
MVGNVYHAPLAHNVWITRSSSDFGDFYEFMHSIAEHEIWCSILIIVRFEYKLPKPCKYISLISWKRCWAWSINSKCNVLLDVSRYPFELSSNCWRDAKFARNSKSVSMKVNRCDGKPFSVAFTIHKRPQRNTLRTFENGAIQIHKTLLCVRATANHPPLIQTVDDIPPTSAAHYFALYE